MYHQERGIVDINESGTEILELHGSALGKHPWDVSPLVQPDGQSSIDLAQKLNQRCVDEGKISFMWKFKTGKHVKWIGITLIHTPFDGQDFIYALLVDHSKEQGYQRKLSEYENHLERLVKERTSELEANEQELLLQHQQLENALSDLKETQEQLISSEKMASLGVLSAGIGHEINNPLNFIKGGINGLQDHLKSLSVDDSITQEYLEVIQEGVSRTIKIVNSLSHYSRATEDMCEECNINEIIDNCLVLLGSKISDRILIKKEYEEAISIPGNEGRLHQAFANIIANAESAIAKTGTIRISIKAIKDGCELTVTDDGVGISKKHLAQVTDPFFTTKSPGEGTGLGLSITKRIIGEHKGSMKIESEKSLGTKVTIWLPAS